MINILIADPDPATRKAFSLLFRHRLASDCLTEAADLETLIRSLVDTPPDVLLLDRRLYGSLAPETCRILRLAYPEMKIVLLSVDANDASAARESGAEFIHKGASPDELIATLEPLLRKDKQ